MPSTTSGRPLQPVVDDPNASPSELHRRSAQVYLEEADCRDRDDPQRDFALERARAHEALADALAEQLGLAPGSVVVDPAVDPEHVHVLPRVLRLGPASPTTVELHGSPDAGGA